MKQELEKYRIKQLSIFSENRPGRLMDLARDMKDVNVNILGFTIAEGSGYGVVRMLVDKPEKALEKLSSQSHVVKFTDVIAVKGYFLGLMHLNIQALPADLLLIVHLSLVVALLVVFPFSKLLHAPGVFFSPTRNQKDDPREKRHLSAWAAKLESEKN